MNNQLPPGQFGLPIIGETLNLVLNQTFFSKKRYQQYETDIFKTSIFGQKFIFVRGEHYCQFVLQNENKYFQSSPLPNIKKLFGENALSNQTGELHTKRRKILKQVFTNKYLDIQEKTIQANTEQYFKKWEKEQTFEWYPELRNYAFDIACSLIIGETNSDLNRELKQWSQGLFTFNPRVVKRALKSRSNILSSLDQIIASAGDRNESALTLMLEAEVEGEKLEVEEIKDQLLNLLAAGHETLASGLTSICLVLGKNPSLKEQIRKEGEEYQTKLIKETLRQYPPVAGGFRRIIEDCSFNGYKFPKDWGLIYEIKETHYSDFLQPEQFDPERFQNPRNPYGFIPFGDGERRCLGERLAYLEMKLFTQYLVNYNWEILPKQDLTIQTTPFPHPKDNLKVTLL